MQIDPLKLCFRILKVILVSITAVLLTYSVVFSIAGTILIYKGYQLAVTPIKKVQLLKDSNPEESLFMSRYRQQLSTQGLSDSLFQIFIPLDSISPHLKNAVIAAEDDGFYTHPGVDLEAIAQASEYNKSQGQFKRGASTLTQQVAKNFFLGGEKSFKRKAKELCFALLMEHYLGKERILELYLNYAQWGKNIFGCEAASQHYFKKSASELNRNEAARLAAVLAMPSKLTPFHKTNFMGKRLAVIANNLYMHKQIDDQGFFGLTGSLPPRKDTLQINNKEKEKVVPVENRTSF
ncbi:MAG: monofunctional biosynthetic peptidoglycan transglycosylase [Fibrobacter sp.]|jgi:monofunctional biosynthetic peptidoglycan transglycosylase|nr:monofunctional biosynthetic peptidoglycan transglycosylase [Fibrobacter sp.]